MIGHTSHNHYAYPRSPYKEEPDTEAEEQEAGPIPKTDQISSKIMTPKSSKIKSSLCKNFMMTGSCPYGQRCQFAHGPQELRCNRTDNTSYKTKPCFSFLNKGFCPYGHRCNFIHQPAESIVDCLFWRKFQNFPQILGLGRDSRAESQLLGNLVTATPFDIYFSRS